MAVVVPGKGWCTVFGDVGAVSTYGLLGPLADDDYLRRVVVMVSSDGVTQGRFSATLGASGEATAEAHLRGAPLIQRSSGATNTIPHIFWYAVAGVPMWFWLPVGIVGSVGSRYVVFQWSAGGELVNKSIMVGLEVLRFVREPKEASP